MMRSATAGANAGFANIATNPIKMWKSDVYTPTAKDQTVKVGQKTRCDKINWKLRHSSKRNNS